MKKELELRILDYAILNFLSSKLLYPAGCADLMWGMFQTKPCSASSPKIYAVSYNFVNDFRLLHVCLFYCFWNKDWMSKLTSCWLKIQEYIKQVNFFKKNCKIVLHKSNSLNYRIKPMRWWKYSTPMKCESNIFEMLNRDMFLV